MTQDTDLTARIATTLAVVLALDALFVGTVASLLRPWFALVVPESASLVGLLALLVPATAAVAWAQLRYTRKETLAETDAEPVSATEYPDLHARMRRLAQSANLAVPKLAVADTEVPNCFTVGGVSEATVVVSTGLLDTLSGDELDAVLAHELAHVRNRDASVMTLATFLPAMASKEYSLFSLGSSALRVVALLVASIVGYAASTTMIGVEPFTFASLLAFAGFVGFTVLFGGVALGALATPVVYLGASLSRDREFVADRAGALITGKPAAMASALEQLDEAAPARPDSDARVGGVRELCFMPHGLSGEDEDPDGPTVPISVETHPPTEERIARLRDLAAESNPYEATRKNWNVETS